MEKQKYALAPEDRDKFAAVYLLSRMINHKVTFNILLDDDESFLEPILKRLLAKDHIVIRDNRYVPAEAGRQCLAGFMNRYAEYLQIFDIYCAVDLNAGKFAFGEMNAEGELLSCPFLDMDDEAYARHLSQPNWEDLRIAVAQFKKMDPIEIVFMSFLKEEKFSLTGDKWEFDLVLGKIWDDILNIANSNLQIADLAYEDVSGEDVIADVISQGTALALAIIKEEFRRNSPAEEDDGESYEETIVTEEVIEEEIYDDIGVCYYDWTYYDPYYDPYYISPFWCEPVIIW